MWSVSSVAVAANPDNYQDVVGQQVKGKLSTMIHPTLLPQTVWEQQKASLMCCKWQ